MTKICISSDFNEQFFGYKSDDFKKKKNVTYKKKKMYEKMLEFLFESDRYLGQGRSFKEPPFTQPSRQ